MYNFSQSGEVDEEKRVVIDYLIDVCNGRTGDRKIDTVDELALAIETLDSCWSDYNLTVDDFLNWSRWGYCGRCRKLLDGGYHVFGEPDEFKDFEEEGNTRAIEELKAYKEAYPNAHSICWDCIDEFMEHKKVLKEMFGEVDFYNIKPDRLDVMINKCDEKKRIYDMVKDDIRRFLVQEERYNKEEERIKKAKEKDDER